jgi:lysophospholipase L1-like esterase
MQELHPRLLAPLLALLALAFCVIGPADAGAVSGRYVALGDSNSNGVGLGTAYPGSIPNCLRTVNGYPSLVASALGFSDFATATCSSAAVRNFYENQDLAPSGTAPPQFNSLNGSETVVSMTIGGNDAGFGFVIGNCFQTSTATPSATPCRNTYGADGAALVQAANNMGYGLGNAIDWVHARSPNATVFIVGYPRLIPPDGANCWGKTNISSADAPVFDVWQRSIAQVQKDIAASHDAVYVDMYDASAGHDGCQSSGQWTNADKTTYPYDHPTLEGEQVMAQRLVTAINTPRPPKGSNGQTLSVAFTPKRVRSASAPLAPITERAPSKHGAKITVTLARAASVDFFIDHAKPGHIKGGKCRALSRRASKGRKTCTRYVNLPTVITLSLPAGTSRVYFTGRTGKKHLTAGRYRVRAVVGSLSAKTPTFSLAN